MIFHHIELRLSFFALTANEEDYVHPALCGVQIFRATIQ